MNRKIHSSPCSLSESLAQNCCLILEAGHPVSESKEKDLHQVVEIELESSAIELVITLAQTRVFLEEGMAILLFPGSISNDPACNNRPLLTMPDSGDNRKRVSCLPILAVRACPYSIALPVKLRRVHWGRQNLSELCISTQLWHLSLSIFYRMKGTRSFRRC